MCGFVGYIQQKKDQVPLKILKNCLDQVKHRGPDGHGLYTHDLVGLGHHRLSIFDTSNAGHQPMERGDHVLIFNGAIYNFLELKKELEHFSFSSNTDTEVIMAAYQKWGTDCVKKFNGQWAFALYDKAKDIVFCSRDRYGIKPFYYLEQDDSFWIGSEIKALLPNQSELKENQSLVLDFLQHGIHDHTEETLFEDIISLPPASNLVYDLYDHSYAIEPYYTLPDQVSDDGLDKSINKFRAHFFEALKYRLRSDVTLGVSLSGGLDSASIACGISSLGSHPHSVSAIYKEKAYSEEKAIDVTAKAANLASHKAMVSEQSVLDALSKVVWYHDQPIASMSVVAQYFNFQKAKENNIKVMLGGQGADETLMGYDSFLKVYLKQLTNPVSLISESLNVALKLPSLISKRLHSQNEPIDYLKVQSSYQFSNYANTKEQSHDLISRTVLPALLHYEDRNAMAHGIESRVPYLDHKLVGLILSVPQEHLIKKGVRKHLQREALRDILPPEILNDNDKKPFISPQEIWMKTNKANYLELIKGHGPYIEHLVNIDKIDSLGFRTLFRILTYAIWRKTFFNQALF